MRAGGKDDTMLKQFSSVSLVAGSLVFNHLYNEVEVECCRRAVLILSYNVTPTH